LQTLLHLGNLLPESGYLIGLFTLIG
jgi:hypothetical protein